MAEFKATNFVNMIGTLSKKKAEFKTSKTGKEYGKVDLWLKVSENEIHNVSFMQMKYNVDKTTNQQVLNPRYTALQTIANEYLSLEDCKNQGLDITNADVVSVSGNLDVDNYVSKATGEVVSTTKIKGFNASRVDNKENAEMKAEFRVHGMLKKKMELYNQNGDLDGVKISLAVPMYNKVEMMDFVIRDEQGCDWIMTETEVEVNTALFVGGRAVNEAITVEVEATSGWGAKVSRAKTTYKNELEITGVELMEEIEDETHPLSLTFINNGLEKRSIMLTELASTQQSIPTVSGFGGTQINKDTIPF